MVEPANHLRARVSERVRIRCLPGKALKWPQVTHRVYPPTHAPLVCCPLHICKPFLHLFYSWTGSFPLYHFPQFEGFLPLSKGDVRSSSLVLSHSPGHLFPPVFLSSRVLLGVFIHGMAVSACPTMKRYPSYWLQPAVMIPRDTSTPLMLPPVSSCTLGMLLTEQIQRAAKNIIYKNIT